MVSDIEIHFFLISECRSIIIPTMAARLHKVRLRTSSILGSHFEMVSGRIGFCGHPRFQNQHYFLYVNRVSL
jgi:hypothetical protein